MTRQEMLARAFDFRRAWREAAADLDVAGSLNHCDALLLSLIVDLEGPTTLHVPDAALARLLERAIEALGRRGDPVVRKDRPLAPCLELSSFDVAASDDVASDDVGADDLAHDPVAPTGRHRLVYDLPGAIPLGSLASLSGQVLVPLARVSAATWASNLALLLPSSDEARASSLAADLRALMSTEELDPLFLLDALNGSARGRAREEAVDLQAMSARCRQLERRIRELEVSGLTRHQDLLADALRRRKS